MNRRVYALLTGLVLVACTVLGFRHEATVVHVRTSTGALIHAAETECHAASTPTHAHKLPADRESDPCELGAFAHASIVLPAPSLTVTPVATIESITASAPGLAPSRSTLLLDAPKTSPPLA